MLHRFGMLNCNPFITALLSNVDLCLTNMHQKPLSSAAHSNYRAIVGGISYIVHYTWPDLNFSIAAIDRIIHAPSGRHLSLAKRLLFYIKRNLYFDLSIERLRKITPGSLRAGVEANWGRFISKRRSTSGYIFAVKGYPIFCKSELQTVIDFSSCEAEEIELSYCVNDITWIRRLVYEIINRKPYTDLIFIPRLTIEIESSVSMYIASNKDSAKLTKHISLRFHHIRHHSQHQRVILKDISTSCKVADPFTNPMSH